LIEAAANPWTKVEEQLAAALPELAAFQEFCEAVNADGATVFLEELGEPLVGEKWSPEELAAVRSYALVSSSRQGAYRIDRTSSNGYSPSGSLLLYLDRQVPPEDEPGAEGPRESRNQQDRWMKNRVGSILQELAAYWDETGGPFLENAEVTDGPYHNDPDSWGTKGHWQGCEIAIAWGARR
jgi:hypothetical protein